MQLADVGEGERAVLPTALVLALIWLLSLALPSHSTFSGMSFGFMGIFPSPGTVPTGPLIWTALPLHHLFFH